MEETSDLQNILVYINISQIKMFGYLHRKKFINCKLMCDLVTKWCEFSV